MRSSRAATKKSNMQPEASAPADNVVDLEMRTDADSHMSLRLWLRLLTTANLIEAELRRRLRAQFDTTLPRFDLMAQLERHPKGLKMSELSRRLMVTGGNVTGITDQLENEGLVARGVDPNDRRAFSVRLTPAGNALFRRMARAHEGWLIELFGGLGADDKSKMHQRLGKLKSHLLETMQR